MIELLEKREYHAKHFDMQAGEVFKKPSVTFEEDPENTTKPKVIPVLDAFGKQVFEDVIVEFDGQYKKYQPHVGHIHYKGTDNSWKEIDFTLEDMGAYWQMTKHSYKLLIAKDFGANQLIRFQNRYRGANHDIVYEPRMLAWVNKTDLSDFQVFRNQQSVQGELKEQITGSGNFNVIRYTNAFGSGIHFEVTLQDSGFKKEIVIDAKNKLELPPTADHKLVALFEYSGSGLKIKSNDKLREWDKENYFEEADGFRVQEEANEVYQSFIRPAYIFDEGNENKAENIKVFWKLHNGKLFQAKVLPTQFLKDAQYPVRADTTTNYYAGGQTGYVYYNTEAAWSTVRNASTAGTFSVSTGSNAVIQIIYGTNYRMLRYFPDFDLSGAPSGQTVSAVSLVVPTGGNTLNNDVTVQIGTWGTTLGVDDWGSFSGNSISRQEWVEDSTVTFPFDANGVSYVNGVFSSAHAFFVLRASEDYDDSPPGVSSAGRTTPSTNYLEIVYAETTGNPSSQAHIIH